MVVTHFTHSIARAVSLVVLSFSVAAVMAAPPKVVSISPPSGSTDVDPKTTAIVVKFDQEMGQGRSWTGGGPHFPELRENAENSGWVNDRTCVLPVKLEAGKVYRLGLNSSSFQNFRNAAGEPLQPQTIVFATTGASPEEIAMMKPPVVTKFNPANGAKQVNPATTEISVTFDQPMGEGMSWTGGGENFPEATSKPTWDEAGKTCTMPVKLKPDHQYQLGINSPSFQNFQNKLGIPVKPVEYKFETGPAQTTE